MSIVLIALVFSWWKMFRTFNISFFLSAVVVRYLTRRYIGEYSSTSGKSLFFPFLLRSLLIFRNRFLVLATRCSKIEPSPAFLSLLSTRPHFVIFTIAVQAYAGITACPHSFLLFLGSDDYFITRTNVTLCFYFARLQSVNAPLFVVLIRDYVLMARNVYRLHWEKSL